MTPATGKLIVIGTSAGGLDALKRVLGALPADFPAPVLVVMHIGARESILPALLRKVCALQVRHARNGEHLAQPTILVAPPDRHLTVVRDGPLACVRLANGPMENYTRPAIDPLFRSAAAAYGAGATGVVLTGYLDDGSAGLRAIKACGGTAVVQDPQDAFAPDMPASALEQVAVDYVLKLDDIGDMLLHLAAAPLRPASEEAAMKRKPADVPEWIRVENSYANGGGNLRELQRIARPSTFSCPECGGALWELNGAAGGQAGAEASAERQSVQQPAPRTRYRCHTGHGFTALALEQTQDRVVEEAVWAAIRALNEKEELARRLAAESGARGLARAAADYEARAASAQRAATVLREALVRDPP
ncbi:chemotaxis protein CheB [Pseudoduganella sp. UC29_71]|uniref:chemotaxis protein CheB n=1 Tax=Pseudoduganella sp. UC29_71 TaxID=3350174 RepID=UPI00366F4F2D